MFGLAASDGIGIGKAFVIPEAEKREIPNYSILPGDRQEQLRRLDSSIATVTTHIAAQMDAVKNNRVQKEIFETYFLMLNDPEFIKDVKKTFEESDKNIEHILNLKTEEYAAKLRSSGNEYLAERAQDITDIFGRVLDDLIDYHPFDIETIPDDVVIVTSNLSPSDTFILSKRRILGIVLSEGGVSSHVGILARNFGIPAVFGIENIFEEFQSGETVIVDGISGEVVTTPDEQTLSDYYKKVDIEKENAARLSAFRDKDARTQDGVEFHLYANIGTVEETQFALDKGAAGIGLFRTEFLFMSNSNSDISPAHSSLFSEESQFESYKKVLEVMGEKPVTIRTLDAGGDKIINSSELKISDEKNPLLGLRAIRLTLANPSLLKTQFRALFRASMYGNLKIMLPLITSEEQIDCALAIAEKVKEELRQENVPFKDNVPIGIMVETAAAAIMADVLAKKVDFFSIGTNDLTQYVIGVDRENPAVSDLFDPCHPAVLRLIKHTVQEAEKAGIPVSVCGEMAGKQESFQILAALGIRNMSMSAIKIASIKEFLSTRTLSEISDSIALNTKG